MNKSIQLKHLSELELLRLSRDFHQRRGPTPDKALADRFPAKVVLGKMAKLDNAGYLEVNVSLRTASLTEKGERRLAELEAILSINRNET